MAATEKILIGEDLQPLKALQQAAKEAFRRIGTVKQAYGTLNIGEFNQEVYNTAIVQGKIEQIRQLYTAEARQAVEKFPNPQIRQNLLAGTGELFNSFADACQYLKKATYNPTSVSGMIPYPLEVICILETGPTITEEAKEAFREKYCRTYVATEQERKVYATFEQFKEAANGLYAMIREAGIPISIYNFNELNSLFGKNSEGEVILKPDTIKWCASRLK